MTGGTESNEALANLVKASGDKDGSIRLALLQRNRGFIYNSWKPFSEIIPESDIDGIGFLAITQACQTFNPDRGFFIRWLSWSLNRELCRASAEECGSLLSLTGRQEAEIRALHKCKRDFIKLHGREPLEAEICACMGISDDELRETRQAERASYHRSLQEPISAGPDDEEMELQDIIPSECDVETDCVNRCFADDLAFFISEVIKGLPRDQRLFVRLRFYENRSLPEISKTMGIQPTDTRRIQSSTLKTLRRNTRLQAFFDSENIYLRTGLQRFRVTNESQTEHDAMLLFSGGRRGHE